jgi:tetratricopeptide (TPR) repeat protein
MAKQPDKAIPHLKRAYGKLAVEANFYPAFYLGQAYMKLNTPGLALPWFEVADQYEPNQPENLSAWAEAAEAAGNHEQATVILRRLAQATPSSRPFQRGFQRRFRN